MIDPLSVRSTSFRVAYLISRQEEQRIPQALLNAVEVLHAGLRFKLNYPQTHARFGESVRQRVSIERLMRVTQLFHAHGARLVSIEWEIPSRAIEKRERSC